MSNDAIPQSVVLEALNRLNHYYAGRARSVLRVMQEQPLTSLIESFSRLALSAAQWQAKQEAVVKVAENLSVELRALAVSMQRQQEDTGITEDHLDELRRILALMEERNGLVQSVDSYQYVQRLHKQARVHLEQLEAERQ